MFLALAPAVDAGGGQQQATIPDCIRVCTPHFTEEGITWECHIECVIDVVQLIFDITANDNDPYMPRFAPSGCPGSCEFGAEAIDYTIGDTVVLRAGLWTVPGGDWFATQPASVGSATFYAVPLVETLVQDDFDALPWMLLGNGTVGSGGFWEFPWQTAIFGDPAGYLLRVDLADAVHGDLIATTIARDPKGCGHHPFGEFPLGASPGANVLSLSVVGTSSPGSTFQARTTGVVAPGAFQLVSAAGLDLPVLGGRLWIDPSQLVLTTFVPAPGGTAAETYQIPLSAALVGVDIYLQAFAEDSARPEDWALSNGVRTTVCP